MGLDDLYNQYGREFIEELIASGSLVADLNEYNEVVIGIGPGLEQACPELYNELLNFAVGVMETMMHAGLVGVYFSDQGEECYYATEAGEQFFGLLSQGRLTYLMEQSLQVDKGTPGVL